jgi:hypothetical protein
MNELFKMTFTLIFVSGVLAAVFGILFVLYAMVFDSSFFTGQEHNGFFIVQYICICIMCIVLGLKSSLEGV